MSDIQKPDYVTALAEDLRTGTASDIWFVPQEGEEAYAERIDITQGAMTEAASLLPDLVAKLEDVVAAASRLVGERELGEGDRADVELQIAAAKDLVERMREPYQADEPAPSVPAFS